MPSELDSATRHYLNLATDSRTLPELPNKKNKTNWVEKAGGLPSYIKRIAKHLHSEKGMDVSRAIAVAVNTVKRWCSSGEITDKGGGGVTAKTKALACKAVASWEAKKASSGINASVNENGKERLVNLEGVMVTESDRDLILSIATEMDAMGDDEFDPDAFYLALDQEREERGLNDDGYALDDEDFDVDEPLHGESLVDERPLSETLSMELDQEIDEDAFDEAIGQARLDLNIGFDEKLHPRLHGKFAKKIGGLSEGTHQLGDSIQIHHDPKHGHFVSSGVHSKEDVHYGGWHKNADAAAKDAASLAVIAQNKRAASASDPVHKQLLDAATQHGFSHHGALTESKRGGYKNHDIAVGTGSEVSGALDVHHKKYSDIHYNVGEGEHYGGAHVHHNKKSGITTVSLVRQDGSTIANIAHADPQEALKLAAARRDKFIANADKRLKKQGKIVHAFKPQPGQHN